MSADNTGDINLGFDLPDVYGEGPEIPAVVNDTFTGARKFAFIGVGQAGSAIVSSLYAMGYRRLLAVYTTEADCAMLKLPNEYRLLVGDSGGSGKNRDTGLDIMERHREEIFSAATRAFGSSFDRVIVIASTGGGTGSGGFPVVASIADDLMQHLRLRKPHEQTRVGLMLVLPSNNDSSIHASNSVAALRDVEQLLNARKVSPVLLADNERLRALSRQGLLARLDAYNTMITTLFHTVNVLSASGTVYRSVFDPEEFDTLLDSGVLALGIVRVPVTGDTVDEKLGVAEMARVSSSMISPPADCGKAKVAAAILMGRGAVLSRPENEKPIDAILSAFNRVVTGAEKTHVGIYPVNGAAQLIALVGGVPLPQDRIRELGAR